MEPEKPRWTLLSRPQMTRKTRFHEFKFNVLPDRLKNVVDLEDETATEITPKTQRIMLLAVVHPETDEILEFEFGDEGLWSLVREMAKGLSERGREQLGRELAGEISFPTFTDPAA